MTEIREMLYAYLGLVYEGLRVGVIQSGVDDDVAHTVCIAQVY